MLDPTTESGHSTYARGDDASRLLWRSQRSKANPWEGRQPDEDEPTAPEPGEAPDEPAEPAIRSRISQTDKLSLHVAEPVTNPFESLLKRRSPH